MHNYSSTYTIDVQPTCTTQGSKSRHCTRSGCTAKVDVTTIPATGHSYVNGVCTGCGDKLIKSLTIYGAANETITVAGTNISFITDLNGKATCTLPAGDLTFTGSISHQSFTRTITDTTTEVYVMPEGALYWYGGADKFRKSGNYGDNQFVQESNSVYLYGRHDTWIDWNGCGALGYKSHNISNYNYLYIKCDVSHSGDISSRQNAIFGLSKGNSTGDGSIYFPFHEYNSMPTVGANIHLGQAYHVSENIYRIDLSNIKSYGNDGWYPALSATGCEGSSSMRVYSMWLE